MPNTAGGGSSQILTLVSGNTRHKTLCVVQEKMKAILTVLLATVTASLAGDVETTAISVTNGTRVVRTQAFTRDGTTNLVCMTYTRDGAINLIRQTVHVRGALALELWEKQDGLTCSAHSIPGVNVGTHFTPDGVLDHVNLMTTNLVTLDHFTVTNGLLHPVSSTDLRKANEVSGDIVELIGSVTNTPPKSSRHGQGN